MNYKDAQIEALRKEVERLTDKNEFLLRRIDFQYEVIQKLNEDEPIQ